MRAARWFTIALAISMPSTLLAQDSKPEPAPPETPTPPEMDAQENREPQEGLPIEKTEPTTEYTAPSPTNEDVTRVRSSVVPAVAGIEAADQAAAALFELTSEPELDADHARKAVKLALQGIEMALDPSESLNQMAELSDDATSGADLAATKLKNAQTTLMQIDKQLGTETTKLSSTTIEEIHAQAKTVHDDLSEASNAVEQVAKAYDVPTDLEFEG